MSSLRGPNSSPFFREVERAIKDSLPSNDFCQAKVAEQLGVSTRTLQRKLKNHGTSFSEILFHVRKEVHRKLKEEHSFTSKEIAFKLGFKNFDSYYGFRKRLRGSH